MLSYQSKAGPALDATGRGVFAVREARAGPAMRVAVAVAIGSVVVAAIHRERASTV